MASISSLSGSSSSSSIYGNRSYNIISGLASGLDTEELISGLVQSYQQKIQSLQNENTKIQWQQESIQSISDKLVEFDRNYSSYVYSDTNLFSSSFFKNAVTTTTNGTYSKMVSASGKSSSEIEINAVKSLATAARYSGINEDLSTSIAATGKDEFQDLNEPMKLSNLAGSLTINYGNRTISIDFSDTELYGDDDGNLNATAFQKAIESKLAEQDISTSSGTVVTADTLISVGVDSDGTVSLTDKKGAGNSVYISGATGKLQSMITDFDSVIDGKKGIFTVQNKNVVSQDTTKLDFLVGKTITVNLDGQSKTIDLLSQEELSSIKDTDSNKTAENFLNALNEKLKQAFGSDPSDPSKARVSVKIDDTTNGLSFATTKGSTLSVTSSNEGVRDIMGIDSGLTNYLDTSKTLEQLGIDPGDGKLVINGVTINETAYTKDTELNTIINAINSNTEAGVNVTYSKITGQFVFTAKDTGSGGRIDIGAGLGKTLFGDSSDYEKGTDATVIATINGQAMELTRSSNSFDLDGMNVTLNGEFNINAEINKQDDGKISIIDSTTNAKITEKVTFTSKTDADKIVDVVKKMVEDMNTIIKEVKNAYSTMPLEQNDGSSYEPLSDEDMADMSESAIETYEEKAKTGILFMDSDLSSLYNDLRNTITSSGADGATLRSIGISTAYSDNLTTITFDEQAFREALENDPDLVQEAFTKSKENGAATDGLMASFKKITDKYAATTGDVKGILIEKAGSQYSPTAALDNTLLNQMKDIEDQISEWQDKMSNQVDYYTNKFTQLELLMNQMNSQSSALAGLMGG